MIYASKFFFFFFLNPPLPILEVLQECTVQVLKECGKVLMHSIHQALLRLHQDGFPE